MTTKEAQERARKNYMNKNNVVTIPRELYNILKSGKYGETLAQSARNIATMLNN